MMYLLFVLFIVALCGMYTALTQEENTESEFRVFFLPMGGSFEYNISTGEGILRGAEPAYKSDWTALNGGYSRQFRFFPHTLNLKDGWDEIKVLLNPETGKAEEVERDYYW